jgi:outer membrane protein OmpA-like peptidoglycan-associated protein
MKRTIFCCLFVLLILAPGSAEVFRFNYRRGDIYRIYYTESQEVFINRLKDHDVQINSKSYVTVTKVQGNTARHEARYTVQEKTTRGRYNDPVEWNQEYASIFTCDQYGTYTISADYFMPVLRNMPVFPEKDLQQEEFWQAQGMKAYDFGRQFGMIRPFQASFTARYVYDGIQQAPEGKVLHIISVKYTVNFNNPQPSRSLRPQPAEYPIRTTGTYSQTIYWDNQRGTIDHYDGQSAIQITTNAGNRYDFNCVASAIVKHYKINDQEIVEEVQAKIEESGIQNITVTGNNLGLTMNIENINFEADSAVLRQSELPTLDIVAKILQFFPGKNVLVEGHTARAGQVQIQQQLSEQRAKVIGDYLVSRGVLDAEQVVVRGYGATKPLASNDTEEGMAKNRRVEITILDSMDSLDVLNK